MNKIFFLLFLFAANIAEGQTSAIAMADSLYAAGNYSEVIKTLKNSPKSTEVELRIARAYKANGEILSALDTYKNLLRQAPELILPKIEYAKLLSNSGQLKEADSLFVELVRLHPSNAGFHYQLAVVREKQKDSTALKHYEFTILLNQSHQQALVKVARYYLSKGKTLKAEILSKQGLKFNPTNISLLSLLAQAFYHQKEYQLAIDEFDKILHLGEGNEFVHLKMARSYVYLENYNKAIEHYNKALNFEEQNPDTHLSLGKLYALIGEYENSEGHLLTALLLKDPVLDAEYLSLGLTYKFQEKPEKALEYFNLALTENPENERARFERAVVADSYYQDLEHRQNLYQNYLSKFKDSGDPRLVKLAQRRISDIRKELHMASKGTE